MHCLIDKVKWLLRLLRQLRSEDELHHVAQLLEELSEFPIAGCYEDVMWEHDMVGYEELRRRANRPIGLHHFPLVSTARGSAFGSGGKRSEGLGLVRRA